jgi:hypothetical protein
LTAAISPSATTTPKETAPAEQNPPMPAVSEKPPEATAAPAVIPPVLPGIGVPIEKQAAPVAAVKVEAAAKIANDSKTITKAETKAAKDAKNEPEDKKQRVSGESDAASRIVIRATQKSWVMVVDDSGKTVFDRVLKPGESYKVPDTRGLSLTTDNSSGIALSLDGKDLPKIGSGASPVVRNIALDPDRLSIESR